MRLLSLKALLPVVALTVACHETTSPPPVVLRSFVLESVDNQPVPVVIHASGGDTTFLYWASLTLYEGGTADIAAHSRQVHATLPPREATDTSHYSYRIIGDSLALDYPCPDAAICVAPPSGKFTSATNLTLYYYDSGNIGHLVTYLYRGPYALD
jgi:hypothetical protein